MILCYENSGYCIMAYYVNIVISSHNYVLYVNNIVITSIILSVFYPFLLQFYIYFIASVHQGRILIVIGYPG